MTSPEEMKPVVAVNDKQLDGIDEFETCEAHMQCSDDSKCLESSPVESELTEVNPTLASEEEAVTMKVTENNEADEQPEAKIDPHTALMQMRVTDQNSALNCLIGFVGIAQRRGVFALDEAAKAFHCIQMFQPGNQQSQ